VISVLLAKYTGQIEIFARGVSVGPLWGNNNTDEMLAWCEISFGLGPTHESFSSMVQVMVHYLFVRGSD